jgi:recombinational DNA repair ATPase RecF
MPKLPYDELLTRYKKLLRENERLLTKVETQAQKLKYLEQNMITPETMEKALTIVLKRRAGQIDGKQND